MLISNVLDHNDKITSILGTLNRTQEKQKTRITWCSSTISTRQRTLNRLQALENSPILADKDRREQGNLRYCKAFYTLNFNPDSIEDSRLFRWKN